MMWFIIKLQEWLNPVNASFSENNYFTKIFSIFITEHISLLLLPILLPDIRSFGFNTNQNSSITLFNCLCDFVYFSLNWHFNFTLTLFCIPSIFSAERTMKINTHMSNYLSHRKISLRTLQTIIRYNFYLNIGYCFI